MFDLRMKAEATDLVEEGGRVVGLRVQTPDGTLTIRADLLVGSEDVIRRCARKPDSKATTTAHRWMCSGSHVAQGQ
jgi:hypothetical protein